jgi:D-sedoheptulose 7-phosphate isomerase
MTTVAQNHFRDVQAALGNIQNREINQVVDYIMAAHRGGRPILTCGNGGSAATAIHLASDLRSLGVQAWDLLSPSKITQLGNDAGYGATFAYQVGQVPDALVVAFSCSGTSENVARLFYEECEVILFTSMLLDTDYPGGMVVCVASDDYEVIEDVHLAICHALKKEVKARLM